MQSRCWECRAEDFPEFRRPRQNIRGNAREFLNVILRDPCAYCGSHENMGADHIDPSCYTGDSRASNLTAACSKCNLAKEDFYLLEHLLGEGLFISARFQPYTRGPTFKETMDLVALASSEVAKCKFSGQVLQ